MVKSRQKRTISVRSVDVSSNFQQTLHIIQVVVYLSGWRATKISGKPSLSSLAVIVEESFVHQVRHEALVFGSGGVSVRYRARILGCPQRASHATKEIREFQGSSLSVDGTVTEFGVLKRVAATNASRRFRLRPMLM